MKIWDSVYILNWLTIFINGRSKLCNRFGYDIGKHFSLVEFWTLGCWKTSLWIWQSLTRFGRSLNRLWKIVNWTRFWFWFDIDWTGYWFLLYVDRTTDWSRDWCFWFNVDWTRNWFWFDVDWTRYWFWLCVNWSLYWLSLSISWHRSLFCCNGIQKFEFVDLDWRCLLVGCRFWCRSVWYWLLYIGWSWWCWGLFWC